MRKYVLLSTVLFAMILEVTGCTGTATLVYSEKESVTTEITEETMSEFAEISEVESSVTEQEETAITEPVEEVSSEDDNGLMAMMELKETSNPRVNEILNVSGTYTDGCNNIDNYSYQIPQFNADNAETLNQRIVDNIYPTIAEEWASMEGGYSLFTYVVSYEVHEYGDIVSLVVVVPWPNDCCSYYAYSYDFANEKEVTNAELLASRGLTEEAFVEKACAMEMEDFRETFYATFADVSENPEEDIITYSSGAREATNTELPMYLDENGILKVYVPFPSIAGSDWYYHLCDF